jgi:phenylalanyl-tRNA synthetase beta chain
MNINASYQWIREFVRTPAAPAEFAKRLSLAGMGVERVHDLSANLDGIVVATAIEVRPHPNANKLQIALVDAGKEVFEVVCGGTNLVAGMRVIFAPVGARVRWHGQGDLVTLASAEIRGVRSAGMICAAEEIGLKELLPHGPTEIVDLTWLNAANGTPLPKALGLDDVVFDIEVTTNRPDALAMIGLAREASAILSVPFLWKQPKLPGVTVSKKESLPLVVSVEAKALCHRYSAVVLRDVRVAPSPWWLKKRLLIAGVHPVNNVVDIMNYVMLETGQPLHAFDYTTLEKQHIVVRTARSGEKITALDGKAYDLQKEQLVIADATRPIAIAGVIGGKDSAIGEKTETIVIEAAAFDPVSIRRTGRGFALHTDAALRYEKGLSAEATAPALARAIQLVQELAGGKIASPIVDIRSKKEKPSVFPFDPVVAARLIGIPVSVQEMKRILTALGFAVKAKGKKYSVTVPWWRTHDIEDSRDFTEEIARIVGYHTLPSVLPPGVPPVRTGADLFSVEDAISTMLCEAGATEVLTNSFVSEELLDWIPSPANVTPVRLANPLSAEFTVMRTSMIPSMLAAVRENIVERPDVTFFEIGNVYLDNGGADLPEHRSQLAIAVAGAGKEGEQYRAAKGLLERIASAWHVKMDTVPETSQGTVWHPGRSAAIRIAEKEIGMIGEAHPLLLKRAGIDRRVALVLCDLASLAALREAPIYRGIPAFPAVKRDVSFVVSQQVRYADVAARLSAVTALLTEAVLFDLYQGKGVPEGKKSMAFHLAFSAPERTLSAEEADVAFGQIVAVLEKDFAAEVRR